MAKNLVKDPTCFKSIENSSTIDLIITNFPRSFMKTKTFDNCLSDLHRIVTTVLNLTYEKPEPKLVKYRDFKKFDHDLFQKDLLTVFNSGCNDYDTFKEMYISTLNLHAPQKQKTIRTQNKFSITLGDMNYAGINWIDGNSDNDGFGFFESTQDAFLEQHVDFATHEGNILDIFLTSNDIQAVSVEDVGNLGKSKHSILLAKVDVSAARLKSSELIPDYSKADFNKLRESMSVDWPSVLNGTTAQENWEIFKMRLE